MRCTTPMACSPLTYRPKIQFRLPASQHGGPQRLMARLDQVWIRLHQGKRLLPGLLEHGRVAYQARGAEFRDPPLSHAEELAGSPDAQIFLRNDESIRGAHEGFQALPRL